MQPLGSAASHIILLNALILVCSVPHTAASNCGCRHSKLDCSGRSLTSLSDLLPVSSECTGLRVIDISNNNLSSLDFSEEFLRENANATIWAENNHLRSVDGLQGWTGQSINVQNNKLTHLNISSLPANILNLRVDKNNLTSLDLSEANQLQYLNIRDNSLRDVIFPTGNCSLVFVDLSGNRLNTLSAALSQCTWLMMLDASNNSMTELPMSVLNITKLRPTRGQSTDDAPQLQIDLRGNPMAAADVISTVQRFQRAEGGLLNFPEDNCGCSVLRTIDRLFAPVKFCVSSMCGERGRNIWTEVRHN